MLFLQIYLVISAVLTVLVIKATEHIPDGPSNVFSAIMLGLIAGLAWPLVILLVASEAASRGDHD